MSNLYVDIDYMKTCTMRYKGAPLHLLKMMKPKVVELKAHIQSEIRKYKEFQQLISSFRLHMHECPGAWMSFFTCM